MMRRSFSLLALVASLATAGGCASVDPNADYDRHSYSRLQEGEVDGALRFLARSSAAYPAENDAAEQVRMQWLEQWLEIRGMCPDGAQILSRERSASVSDRFGYDLTYEIRCR